MDPIAAGLENRSRGPGVPVGTVIKAGGGVDQIERRPLSHLLVCSAAAGASAQSCRLPQLPACPTLLPAAAVCEWRQAGRRRPTSTRRPQRPRWPAGHGTRIAAPRRGVQLLMHTLRGACSFYFAAGPGFSPSAVAGFVVCWSGRHPGMPAGNKSGAAPQRFASPRPRPLPSPSLVARPPPLRLRCFRSAIAACPSPSIVGFRPP